MQATLEPRHLDGTIAAIPSKSYAHRLLICAALADAPTLIACHTLSVDILATTECLKRLGADISWKDGVFTVHPIKRPVSNALLDCAESGTTLRFLLPILCALGAEGALTGRGRLPERPLSPLYEELEAHGVTLSEQGRFPLTVKGALRGGAYSLAANISSQFIGGLLLALPLLKEDSTLTLTATIESRPYIDMTLDVLALFGIVIEKSDDFRVFKIQGAQTLRSPGKACVEGDWSNAAFWLTAGACGGNITMTGLNPQSRQGDRHILDILKSLGAEVSVSNNAITVKGNALTARSINASDIPDLVPVLAVAATAAQGTSIFTHAQRLRIKESDRLSTVYALLKTLGAHVEEKADGLVIEGGRALTGATIDSANDHRIAMSGAIAATLCRGRVIINGAEAVQKSYPSFFDDYRALGGHVSLNTDEGR